MDDIMLPSFSQEGKVNWKQLHIFTYYIKMSSRFSSLEMLSFKWIIKILVRLVYDLIHTNHLFPIKVELLSGKVLFHNDKHMLISSL